MHMFMYIVHRRVWPIVHTRIHKHVHLHTQAQTCCMYILDVCMYISKHVCMCLYISASWNRHTPSYTQTHTHRVFFNRYGTKRCPKWTKKLFVGHFEPFWAIRVCVSVCCVSMWVCVCLRMCRCECVYVSICANVCVCLSVCVYVCMCVCVCVGCVSFKCFYFGV